MTEHPVINILGEKVALGPIRRDLMPLYNRWINDFEVLEYMGALQQPMTQEAEEAWFAQASRPQETSVDFLIYELPSYRPIGTTDLRNIDFRNRSAQFGIIIGEKDAWSKGYGTEATELMLHYAFNDLGLHSVWLTVFSFDPRGIRAYEKAGFKVVGSQREAHWAKGRFHDIVIMDCLSKDFDGKGFNRLLSND